MTEKPEFEIIDPPHDLNKAKTGSGPAIHDHKAIERAEDAVAEIGRTFTTWAVEDLDMMDLALDRARNDPADQERQFAHIFRRAMDLKGQGGSFGYTLITEIGDSLKRFTERRTQANPRDVDIIAAHIDAMRSVVVRDVMGDGGDVGCEIVAGLEKLTATIS